METVTIKLQKSVAKKIDKNLKDFHYSTKSEFIREAVREKLAKLEKEKAWNKFFSLRGALKNSNVSDERLKEIRREVSRELENRFPKVK